MKLQNYKWYIIGYILYLTILFLLMPEYYFYNNYKIGIWKYIVGLAITLPIVFYIAYSIYQNYKHHGKNAFNPSNQNDASTTIIDNDSEIIEK